MGKARVKEMVWGEGGEEGGEGENREKRRGVAERGGERETEKEGVGS